MEKLIKIGNTEVRLSNNVAWTMEYRDQFGKDIVPTLLPVLQAGMEGIATIIADAELNSADGKLTVNSAKSIAEAVQGRAMDILLPLFQMEFVDVIINITWAMAKAADESLEPPKRWVRQFDSFPLDVILPEVGELVIKGFVSSKNLKRLKNLGASLKTLQPSHSTTSSSQDLSED
jgi:hypothetical protein